MGRSGGSHNTRAHVAAVEPMEAILVLFVLVLLALAVIVSSPRPTRQIHTSTITVRQGDTLWSIAESYPVPGLATAEAASLVAKINGLERASIRPGDVIKVPVPAPDPQAYAMR